MVLDDFIKEFSKNEGKINKGSTLGSIPHGSEALIISKISQHIKKDILFVYFLLSFCSKGNNFSEVFSASIS